MTDRFANLADAGRALGHAIGQRDVPADALLLAVVPNGVPVALAAAQQCGLRVLPLRVERTSDGVTLLSPPEVSGATVLVIDDGVETGTVARAVASPLRESGAARVILAVPVCPREALADLAMRYDEVIAVVTPLVRRSLSWHFDDFDTVDDAAAEELLASDA